MHYEPPRPCVIEIYGEHSHDLTCHDVLPMKGMTEEVKKLFFKYFDNGLSASSAKKKYELNHKQKTSNNKNSSKSKLSFSPTIRQTQHLYNHWKDLKNSTKATENGTNGLIKPVSFKDFLNAVPKREIMHSVNTFPEEIEENTSQNIQLPLMFISIGIVGVVPTDTAPLLYKLKHGVGGEVLSELVSPRIYSIRIDSTTPLIIQDSVPVSAENSQTSSEYITSDILNIPILNVKTEPMDIDEGNAASSSVETISLNTGDPVCSNTVVAISSNNMDLQSSQMPFIVDAFSCEGSSKDNDVKPNISEYSSQESIEDDTKPNIRTGNGFFPLVFRLAGSIAESSNSRSLIYTLKQGVNGLLVTKNSMPQIFSVQMNSATDVTFKFKDSSILKAQGSLKFHMKITPDLDKSKNNFNASITPVILHVSSMNNCFPAVNNNFPPTNKSAIAELTGPYTEIKNYRKSGDFLRNNNYTVVSTSKNGSELVQDDDFRFLLSLLPLLKKLPQSAKVNLRTKIKEVIVDFFKEREVQFDKTCTNVYRDFLYGRKKLNENDQLNKQTGLTVSTLASQTDNAKGKRKEAATQRKRRLEKGKRKETAPQRKRRLEKGIETATQRSIRLEKEKQKRQEKLATETEEEKRLRLDKRHLRLQDESQEMRKARLLADRQRHALRITNETQARRELRLQDLRRRQALRIANETKEQRETRLQDLRRRQALRIANETPEQREARLLADRQRHALSTTNGSQEQRELRLQDLRPRQALRIANAAQEQLETRLLADRQKPALSLTNETQEQLELRLQDLPRRQELMIANETEEQRETLLADHQILALSITNETQEQHVLRLQDLRRRQALSITNETQEQRELRLQDLRRRQALSITNETQEQRELRLQDLRRRQTLRIANETQELRQTGLLADHQIHALSLTNETQDPNVQSFNRPRYKTYNRKIHALSITNETQEQRELRLQALKIANETQEQRETGLLADPLKYALAIIE
ncbi:uncharacterized protein CEXT_598692 [Caerostris extrusa]|uniref:BESS domain-containing protein n=1 Tax=Caerostris extrusa TaxID=172846 RepID=A0AAV4USN1_CAEEX|nr:uncharacterized protein CEXT_598692 [Caerostris extrusa]